MYGFIILLILLTVVILGMSAMNMLAIEAYIYVFELLLIGMIMTFMTVYLIRLMILLFGDFFVNEKNSLKISLILFDLTYLVRAAFFITIRFK
jgi:hypothetical protein